MLCSRRIGLTIICVISCMLLSELHYAQGKLCSSHLRSYYRNKRTPQTEQIVRLLFKWLSTGTNGSYPRPEHDVDSTSDFYSALSELQLVSTPSQLAYSNLLQSVSDIATSRKSNCVQGDLARPRIHRVESTISKLQRLLKTEGYSVKIREYFSYLMCVAFRFGVLGPSLKQTLDMGQTMVYDALTEFFASIMKDPSLLAQILGTSFLPPSLGIVVSLHSDARQIGHLQAIAGNLIVEADGLVHFFLFQTISSTNPIPEPSMHRLSNPPRLRKLQTTIDELSSIPPGVNCSEPCLGPLLAVIEQSRLHSTIVLMTSVPPSDADLFALVMDLARLKDIKIHFILSEPWCGSDLQVYVDLAQHTGGAVLTSFSNFVDFFTFQQSSGISGPLTNAPQGKGPIQLATNCRRFTVTTLDEMVLLTFFSEVNQTLLLQDPDGQVTTYQMNQYLNISLDNPTSGSWVACVHGGSFELLVSFPQMYDSSVEYLRSRNGRFEVEPEASGCNRHKLIIQSPRHKLIGSECPLRLHLVQRNGTIYDDIELLNCGPFLEARMNLAPMSLIFRVSGCDKDENKFEKNLIAPFFKPTVAMVTMRRAPSSRTSRRSILLKGEELVTVNYIIESSELEEIRVTFKINKKKFSARIRQFPNEVVIPPRGRRMVSFTYITKTIASKKNGRLRFITKVVTKSKDVKFGCAFWEHFQLEKGINQCGCRNGGRCVWILARNRQARNEQCLCSRLFTGQFCEERRFTGQDTPNCTRECEFGTCIADNTCMCSVGYTGQYCDAPVCSRPCMNGGLCFAPNLCECAEGYNGTDCENPICTEVCENNSTCTAPDVCTCTSGYTGTSCNTPICTRTCVNGDCTAPETCTCNPGYTGRRCNRPVCSEPCVNGRCTSPDVCTCTNGYTGTSCNTPICTRTCVNGDCTAPETCTCTVGYSGSSCDLPVCSQPCLNGGSCVGPNTCECPEGFEGTLCETEVKQTCSPSCKNGGLCMDKDTCECADGYTGDSCETPICTRRCINGDCTAPDTCTCNPGYTGRRCNRPVCSEPCVNGRCTSPDVCTCTNGYTGASCNTPICTRTCVNGDCTAPETCTCTVGYSGSSCDLPICSQPCLNGGSCVGPDTCDCPEGFEGTLCETEVKQTCSPSCKNGGLCVDKDTCECADGYTGDSCETPICTRRCVNGDCTAPDTCTCNPGYTGRRCNSPVCSEPCVNGRCTSPDVCTCTNGYTGASCNTPICTPTCVNGDCTAPDTCTCNPGYTGRRCDRPVCSESCVNGRCTEPEVCSCNSGYTGARCEVPICSNPCLNNGTCIDVDTCACPPEFIGDQCQLLDCSCMNGGTCGSGRICQCVNGYGGNMCEIPLCDPPCLNGGTCTDEHTCDCISSSFEGDACQFRICSDYDYYFGYMANIDKFNFPGKLLIFSQEDENVNVSIHRPKTGITRATVGPDAPFVLTINPSDQDYEISSDSDNDKGLYVQSQNRKRIKVLMVNEAPGSIGVTPVIPTVYNTNAGPYTFYPVSVDTFRAPDGSTVAGVQSAVLLVGTVDNTSVTMISPYTKLFLGRPQFANRPFTFVIDEGETLLYTDRRDLTGIVFESDKWITVISGHECGNVPSNLPFCDHFAKQMPPTRSWGTKFVTGDLATRESGYVIKMVSSQPNTDVTVTFWNSSVAVNSMSFALTLSGSHEIVEVPRGLDSTVEATKEILVVQFARGQGERTIDVGDPCMAVVPSSDQYSASMRFTTVGSQTPLRDRTAVHSINLVVEETWAQPDQIELDDTSLADLGVVARWVEFSTSQRYAIFTHRISVKGIHNIQHVNREAEMSLMMFGFADNWGYCYSSLEEALRCSTTSGP